MLPVLSSAAATDTAVEFRWLSTASQQACCGADVCVADDFPASVISRPASAQVVARFRDEPARGGARHGGAVRLARGRHGAESRRQEAPGLGPGARGSRLAAQLCLELEGHDAHTT